MSNFFNSASTKPKLEDEDEEEILSTPSTPMVDLNVMTKEPSIVNNDEDMEFILEIEDMQSVVSNLVANDSSYNINPRKRKVHKSLGEMYSDYENKNGFKRVKVSETETKGNEYYEGDTTIYDQTDLYEFIKTDARVTISPNITENTRSVRSNLPKTHTEEVAYFQEITEQLEELCDTYNKGMEEIHTLWMENCCDLEDLKKMLAGETKRWTVLEDLAVQSDPGSQEFGAVKSHRGEEQVLKRKQFLEMM